jgi:glycosyltransferase involved in cell wall biosynthesis
VSSDARPVALVTGEVSPYRERPFAMLAEAEGVEVLAHAGAQVDVVRRVASGRYRAVICGIGGRVALPGTYLAARRTHVPFILWTSLWAHPRTPAHALSWRATRHLYAHADAVVTYGSHVTRYVRRHRTGPIFEAPQAVSAKLFPGQVERPELDAARARLGAREGDFVLLFVGRLVREKGIEVLLDAWRRAGVERGVLALAGDGPLRAKAGAAGARTLGQVARAELPALYAAADGAALPSVRSATFLEPWGLVVNEAMHMGTPVIVSDEVGAAAGGLVRDGRNGLVVPAGDAQALASRIRSLAASEVLRGELAAQARTDVGAYSEAAWVEGMRAALRAVGAGRES